MPHSWNCTEKSENSSFQPGNQEDRKLVFAYHLKVGTFQAWFTNKFSGGNWEERGGGNFSFFLLILVGLVSSPPLPQEHILHDGPVGSSLLVNTLPQDAALASYHVPKSLFTNYKILEEKYSFNFLGQAIFLAVLSCLHHSRSKSGAQKKYFPEPIAGPSLGSSSDSSFVGCVN